MNFGDSTSRTDKSTQWRASLTSSRTKRTTSTTTSSPSTSADCCSPTRSFCPLKHMAYSVDVPGVAVHDWDWNEGVVRASKPVEFAFEGNGELDRGTGNLVSADAWLVY